MQWINFISFVCLCYSVLKVGTVQYSNRWSVQIEGGKEEADRLATKHGFINEGKVGRYKAECWPFEIVVVTAYFSFTLTTRTLERAIKDYYVDRVNREQPHCFSFAIIFCYFCCKQNNVFDLYITQLFNLSLLADYLLGDLSIRDTRRSEVLRSEF